MPSITQQQQTSLIQRICTKERIPHTIAGIRELVSLGENDCRFTLNALQSVLLATGEVTVESVKETSIGNKEVVKDLQDYWRLVFLCQREHGRR